MPDWFAKHAPKASAAPDWFSQHAPSPAPSDFTSNPKGEGLYLMVPDIPPDSPNEEFYKKQIQVPFSKVREAQGAGYLLGGGDDTRYKKDFAHQGEGPTKWERFNTYLATPTPSGPYGVQIGPVSNTDKAFLRTILSTPGWASGVYHAAVQGDGEELLRLLDPVSGAQGLYEQFQEDKKAHGPQFAAQNLMGTLLGTGATALIVHGVADRLGGPVTSALRDTADRARGRVGGLMRNSTEVLTKTTPADTAEWAKETGEKYGAAEHETQGRELMRRQEVRTKAEELENKESVEAQKEKVKHESELEQVREHNNRIKAKHAATARHIQEENAAQDNMLHLRQQKEAELQKGTDEYRAQEDTEDKAAKAKENVAWTQWRTKMKGATIDAGEIAGPLKKLRLDSPEVDRTLRQLEPSGDEVPQESPYYRLRDQTAVQNIGKPYADLSPMQQDVIDRAMVAHGESPEPIDLNLEDGQPVSVERVQRASSILQRYIRSGRFEGPLLGEMKQVAKVLRRAVTNASDEHGALGDLNAARSETVRYQEAFGRERPEPRTVRGEREKTANPEEVKRLQEEERLEAVRKYNPALADFQEKVRALRDELKKMPSEEQLRKGRKQVPAPPSVNDFREAYRLKEEPKAPPLRLTAGSAEERAGQLVNPSEKVDTSKLGTTNLYEHNREFISKRGEGIREYGAHRVGWSLGLGLSTGLATAIFGHPILGVFDGITAAVGGLYGSYAVDKALSSSAVADWIARPTDAQWNAIQSLPPDVKAKFERGIAPVVQAAQARGMPVFPRLAALVAANAALHGPATRRLQELRDQHRTATQ